MAEREWFEKDFYKVLGVSETASDKEITRAYRKLAKELHPDTHPGSEEQFKEVTAAYDVIGDAEKRKEYDEVRRLGPVAGGFPSGQQFGDFGDLGDILGGIFGRSGRTTRARRGDDIETALHLNFRDAVFGVTTSVSLPSHDSCTACHGSGAAPGTSMVTCGTCQGRGVLADDQGPFSLSRTCPTCHGRGGRLERPCAACGGSGRQASSRSVQVRLPAGVEDGQRIRVKGKGGPGSHGGPAGDLYVDVHVTADRRFARRGRHVTTTVTVPVTEALLGSTVSVPTLDDPVTLKIAAGTQPGTTMRVKGRGVPAHGKHAAGDLLVTVQIDIPTALNETQRNLVEQLAASLNTEEKV
jgi:molecular chaperone DnaJ